MWGLRQHSERQHARSANNPTQGEAAVWGLRQYFPNLKRWQLPADQLPPATSPIKQQLIDEVNALGIYP